jgi:TfoX/Sxy family transcriptional regulator of competence genes
VAFDQQLASRVRELLVAENGVTEKHMFGGLAFFIDGNMAVSASGQGGLLLRVDPAQSHELLGRAHAHPMVMRGREMDGWIRVDAEGVHTQPQLDEWVSVGVGYARSLPPK